MNIHGIFVIVGEKETKCFKVMWILLYFKVMWYFLKRTKIIQSYMALLDKELKQFKDMWHFLDKETKYLRVMWYFWIKNLVI